MVPAVALQISMLTTVVSMKVTIRVVWVYPCVVANLDSMQKANGFSAPVNVGTAMGKLPLSQIVTQQPLW